MKNNYIKTISALILGMVAFVGQANASYWSRTDYGQYSSYSGTRVGGWNLSGGTTNDYVFYGQSQYCQPGSNNCTQTYTQAVSFSWTFSESVTYKQTIIPAVNELSVTLAYTIGKTFTDTNSYSVNVNAGKTSQYAEFVPRRYGNATVYGVRVATGNTRSVCTRQGPLHCYKHATEWEYNDEPNRVASVMWGNASTSNTPVHTFIIR